jgi:hypothetical protein
VAGAGELSVASVEGISAGIFEASAGVSVETGVGA